VNARGDAVAAWSGGGAKGVWIANRPAGALFGSPRQVSDGSGPHVAINDAGLAAVAWSAGANGVRAAVGSGTEDVSGSDHPASTGWAPLDVAVNRRGDVLVAWFQPDGQLVAAWRPAGGAFGDPQVLGTYGLATVIVTLDDAGRGVVAWASYDPPWRPAPDTPPTRVWVAQGGVGGAFGSPTALSGSGPSDNVDGGFHAAGNARGDVVVTWAVRPTGSSSSPGLRFGIYAASRSAGGAFEPRDSSCPAKAHRLLLSRTRSAQWIRAATPP
jgi:hypothetical protein